MSNYADERRPVGGQGCAKIEESHGTWRLIFGGRHRQGFAPPEGFSFLELSGKDAFQRYCTNLLLQRKTCQSKNRRPAGTKSKPGPGAA